MSDRIDIGAVEPLLVYADFLESAPETRRQADIRWMVAKYLPDEPLASVQLASAQRQIQSLRFELEQTRRDLVHCEKVIGDLQDEIGTLRAVRHA